MKFLLSKELLKHSLFTGFFSLLLLTTISLQAQQIKGTITDQQGVALVGASVLVEGTQTGALTDQQGVFTLNVPEGGEKLIVSYIGFNRQVVAINGQADFDH